jgi:hypothetical protein
MCDFYLPQRYTGAGHQNLCSLNNNIGKEGAVHRNIPSMNKLSFKSDKMRFVYQIITLKLILLNNFVFLNHDLIL